MQSLSLCMNFCHVVRCLGLAQFLFWEETFTVSLSAKELDHCFPDSHFEENKELLQNQQKHIEF